MLLFVVVVRIRFYVSTGFGRTYNSVQYNILARVERINNELIIKIEF